MMPFTAAAILTILFAAAGSAWAIPYYGTVTNPGGVAPGTYTVDPVGFGGFSTTGETPTFTGQTQNDWQPGDTLDDPAPTSFDVIQQNPGGSTSPVAGNLPYGSGQNPANYLKLRTSNDTQWYYAGLQDIAVPIYITVTVSAYVDSIQIGNMLGIGYADSGNSTSSYFNATSFSSNGPGNVATSYSSAIGSTGGVTTDFSTNAQYQLESITITNVQYSNIDIYFGFETAISSNAGVNLAGISVTDTPEPASIALLGAGLLGLGLLRRRRRC